jgi:dephospho-CoA kinase
MIKVGLTGGIGSGKSTVASVFEILGIPVYYADDAAKRLMVSMPSLKESIKDIFGDHAYTNNSLNKAFISEAIFSDPSKRELLNAAVHPVTIQDAKNWFTVQHSPYAIKEAALIFESHGNRDLDLVIGVFTPLHLRIERIMERDGLKKEEVIARMKSQMDEDEKMKLCNFVIVNDELSSLITQVIEIHHQILSRTV